RNRGLPQRAGPQGEVGDKLRRLSYIYRAITTTEGLRQWREARFQICDSSVQLVAVEIPLRADVLNVDLNSAVSPAGCPDIRFFPACPAGEGPREKLRYGVMFSARHDAVLRYQTALILANAPSAYIYYFRRAGA